MTESPNAPSPAEVHRRVVELFPEMLRTGEVGEALELIDPEVVDHRGGADGDHRGLDAWRRKWEGMAGGGGAFRDLSVTIEQNVAAGDTSVNRYALRGTHTASGRRYEIYGLDMVRVRDGRLVEHWALQDAAGIEHQLGLD